MLDIYQQVVHEVYIMVARVVCQIQKLFSLFLRFFEYQQPLHLALGLFEFVHEARILLSWGNKAVVAGPAGRRAPDHFLGRVCFPPFPFFSFRLILHFTSDFIQSSTIF